MSSTAKNLLIVLGIVTLSYAGYYFFVQESSLVIRSSESNQQLAQMLARTQEFVGHRQILNSISLDTGVLEQAEFQSLRSFSPDPIEFTVGRDNPFILPDPEQSQTTAVVNNTIEVVSEPE
jgi:hypothetical protein